MSWIREHKPVLRAAVLTLLLVALLGPWAFDAINVPSQYPCGAPFVRLEGDFCGLPLSGIWILSWIGGGLIQMVAGLFTGATVLPDRAREFLGVLLYVTLLLLLLLPFLSALLLMLRETRHRQVFHIAALGLAAGSSLFMSIAGFSRASWALWGIWVYAGVAASALILEVYVLNRGDKTWPRSDSFFSYRQTINH